MAKEKAIPPDLQAVVDEVKAAAGEAASTIDALRGQISTGMSQSDVDSLKSQLGEVATNLRGASNPPPPPTP